MDAQTQRNRFAELIDEHKGIIYKICRSYCPRRDDHDDLAQEILLAVWRSLPRYDQERRFSTWMYRIALNVAISYHRSQTARSRRHDDRELSLVHIVDESHNESEQLTILYDAIAARKPLDRALVLLSLEGYGQDEIAAIVGLSKTNVATKLHRIKTQLKEDLNRGY